VGPVHRRTKMTMEKREEEGGGVEGNIHIGPIFFITVPTVNFPLTFLN
jgi:hypothetical protein